MATHASTTSSAHKGPAPPIPGHERNYAVVLHKSRTAQSLPSTKTIHTTPTLAEAWEYVETMVYILTEQHDDVEINSEHNTGKTILLNKDSRTVFSTLWIETLEPDFVGAVRKNPNGDTMSKPQFEVKTATWHEEEKLWEVLVTDKLTRAERTFTLASFVNSGTKPWEKEGAWESAGAVVMDSNSRASRRRALSSAAYVYAEEEPRITRRNVRPSLMENSVLYRAR